MGNVDIYPVMPWWRENGRIDAAARSALYDRSLADPDAFWLDQARRLDWTTFPQTAGDW